MEVKPGYKQTDAEVIPEDWEVKSIQDIASVTAGGTPSRTNRSYWNGRIPWITTSQIDFNTITNADQFITAEGLQNSAAKLLPQGTLLMALYGQGKTRGKIGILGIEAATNQACAAITLNSGISRGYLFCFLASQYETIRNLSNMGSQENLNGQIVKSIRVLVPPEHEQRAIAIALNDVDALIRSLDQLIAKKRDLKRATMQQILTGKQRLSGFQGKWQMRRLGSLLKFQVGFPFRSKFFNQKGKGTRLIKNRDLKSDDQVFHYSGKYDPAYLVINGDVLVGMDGDFMPSVWREGQALLNQRVGRIVPNTGMNEGFAYYFLIEPLKEIETVTSSTTVKHLSHSDVECIEKPIPSIAEQAAIAFVLSDMDAEIAALERRRDKTRALKQGMMQELLTGRTRLV